MATVKKTKKKKGRGLKGLRSGGAGSAGSELRPALVEKTPPCVGTCPNNNAIREMTFKGTSTMAVREQARVSGGLVTLTEDGIRKVIDGVTSLDEVLAATVSTDQTATV